MCNTTAGGSLDQILYLVKQGVIQAICLLLNNSIDNKSILSVLLEGLDNILKMIKPMDDNQATLINVRTIIEVSGGLDALESLQNHENNEIYEASAKIIENYFEQADETNEEQEPAIESEIIENDETNIVMNHLTNMNVTDNKSMEF